MNNSDIITLGHGSGGAMMQQLIVDELLPAFPGQSAEALEDAAIVEIPSGRLAFSTDSFTVQPLIFPGGDIGRLAVHGTVNDVAMRGATPKYLSLGLIIEEGFAIETFRTILRSIGEAVAEAGVQIVAGDTKVVGKGSADGIFINTAGIGECSEYAPSVTCARPGDVVIVNGTLGDHGMAVMVARENLQISTPILSDTAALDTLVAAMLKVGGAGVHTLRDLTRGGLAAGLNEIASSSGVGLNISSAAVPVRPEVAGACEILGLSPFLVANEGKLVAMVAADMADAVLAAMQGHPLGEEAAIIGEVVEGHSGTVHLQTPLGTSRVLELPAGELLPRIC